MSQAAAFPPLDEPPPPEPQPRSAAPRSAVTLSLLILVVAGVSLALCLQLVTMRRATLESFLAYNRILPPGRTILLVSVLAGGVAAMLVAGLVAWLGRRKGAGAERSGLAAQALSRAAALAAPLIPVAILPALFSPGFARSWTLTYLVLLALFAVTFEPLVRWSFPAWASLLPAPGGRLRRISGALGRLPRPSSRVFWFTVVVLASAAYATYVGYFTILNHRRLGTTAFDLGIYDQLMYTTMHGKIFWSTVLFGPNGGNNLASHAEFAMVLFIPFYAIRPGAETMLIIQAVVLGFAAVPLYLFASTFLARSVAAVIALAYLLFAPLHGPNFYDFHWLPLAIFFHFWLYYAIARRKNWLIVTMLVILYAFREDVAVGLALLGLFLLLTGLRPRLGLVMAIVSVVWFVIVRFGIMFAAGNWYFQNFYNELFAEGVSTYGSVVKTIVTNPTYFLSTLVRENKLAYVLHMMAPLALLPVRRAPFLLLAFAGFFFTVMTTGYAPTLAISFQYTTHWIPYLFLATVLALVVISRQPNGTYARRAALLAMAVVTLSHSYNFGAILQREMFVGGFGKIEFKMTEAEKRRYQHLKELVAMIPRNASVAATEHENPHISARMHALPLRTAPGPVDYVLVGRSHIGGDLSRGPLNAALSDPAYGLLAQRDNELYLFKRGHSSPETAMAKMMLGVP